MAKDEERVECRTPTAGRDGVTRIPKWKYELLEGHILDVIAGADEDGVAYSSLKGAIDARLSDDARANLGKLGWHVIAVKLNMEVTGALDRVQRAGRQHVIRGPKWPR